MYGLSTHDQAMAERQRRAANQRIDDDERIRFATQNLAKIAADDLALAISRDVFVYRRDTGGYKITVTRCGEPLYTAHDVPF